MPATLLLLHPLPTWGRSRLPQDLSHAEQHSLLHRDPGIWAGVGHQAGLPEAECWAQDAGQCLAQVPVGVHQASVLRSQRVGGSRAPSCLGCVFRAESEECGMTP